MLKRPHWVGLGVAVVSALVLLNLAPGTSSRVKNALSSLYLPLFGLASSAQKAGEAAGMRAVPKGTLIEQLEKLRRENDELHLEAIQFQETARENATLRDALNWQKGKQWKMRLARVISRDPANWWHTVQIDLGSNQGVTKNMPVIAPQGLVGRVLESGANRSRVILIGDPHCQVPAVVDNAGRDTGTIRPGEFSVLDESILELSFLKRSSQAIPGQKVFTSGLGDFFPKGLPIGTITETNSVSYGLYIAARVKLSANVNELEEVWVLYP